MDTLSLYACHKSFFILSYGEKCNKETDFYDEMYILFAKHRMHAMRNVIKIVCDTSSTIVCGGMFVPTVEKKSYELLVFHRFHKI